VTTPKLIGLTGGIASGKSTVAAMLAELGATVVDADQLAREVTEPGSPALDEIRTHFGATVFAANGGLDRAALAKVVFTEPDKRVLLESITHPLIIELSKQRIAAAMASGVLLVVYAIPLLFERGLEQWLGEVIVVDVDEATQRQRLLGRDGAAGMDRLGSQLPLSEKRKRATYLIDNAGTREQTRAQVEALWRKLIG
jgi:dephospho-CoA kinase